MDSSSANTTNMSSTPYVSTTNIGETVQQPQQQNAATNNVDMTGGNTTTEVTSTETAVVDKPQERFDTNNKPLSASYVKKKRDA